MKPSGIALMHPTPRIRFKNILFATDLGVASEQAQVYATLLARLFGAHLFVLHVSATGVQDVAEAPAENAEITPRLTIGELHTFFQDAGVPFTLLLERGEIRETLDRVADKYFIDLIILGSHGRHGISYLFMGSVSENVSRSSTRPVITVGPKAWAREPPHRSRNSQRPHFPFRFELSRSDWNNLELR